MRRVTGIIVLCCLALGGMAVAGVRPALSQSEEKVTICHAAGLAGTTHYVTLTISRNAVFGPAGHFYENGTPQAGHEQDYMGACTTDTTTTDTTTTTTTTTGPVDVCPNIPGNQETVPPGFRIENGICVLIPTTTFETTTTPPPTTTDTTTTTDTGTTTTTTTTGETTTSPGETTTTPSDSTTIETTTEETTTTDQPTGPSPPSSPKPKPKPKPRPNAPGAPVPLCPQTGSSTTPCAVQGSG
jgi:hypothetical protein